MPVTRVRKGLDVPLDGALESTDVVDGPRIQHVALLPPDTVGLKIRLLIREGDRVKCGTPVYVDRREERVIYTSPAAGEVVSINRGERRKVLSVVIKVDAEEEHESFTTLDPQSASGDQIRELLGKSGLWPCLRQRPFDKVAQYDDKPHAVFITAMDTHPLAPPVETILAGQEDHFKLGAQTVAKLTDGKTYCCSAEGKKSTAFDIPGVEHHEFAGPHPAGNAGVHINALDPVGANRVAWHIGYQDVIAIGELVKSGKVPAGRIVGLVGPGAKKTQLVRTRRGASTQELLADNVAVDSVRAVSGSALSGTIANPGTPEGYLGRYDNQLTVLEEASPRELLGWAGPGTSKYSLTNTFLGKFMRKSFRFNTDTNGSLRAIVPIGVYEEVMPMSIQPTFLIKALCSNDIESAEQLGALELAEEDLALCEFVCPSKISITEMLRDMLTRIEKEG